MKKATVLIVAALGCAAAEDASYDEYNPEPTYFGGAAGDASVAAEDHPLTLGAIFDHASIGAVTSPFRAAPPRALGSPARGRGAGAGPPRAIAATGRLVGAFRGRLA